MNNNFGTEGATRLMINLSELQYLTIDRNHLDGEVFEHLGRNGCNLQTLGIVDIICRQRLKVLLLLKLPRLSLYHINMEPFTRQEIKTLRPKCTVLMDHRKPEN